MSVTNPDANLWAKIDKYIERHPLIPRVFDLALARQMNIYLVGGSVRDLLLDLETHDLDFAVEGDSLKLARYVADELHGAYVTLDKERKTARVILSTPDRSRIYLDIAALRGNDLAADLRDRDFTINAMALERTTKSHWRLYDPLKGSHDLRKKILRAVLPSSFENDPIRTLRAVRMQAQFRCTIEPQTGDWLKAAVPLLPCVSAERVRDEWFKILEQPGADMALFKLFKLNLLHFIVPQVTKLEGLEQSAPQRFAVLTHSFEVVRAIETIWTVLQGQELGNELFFPDAFHALATQLCQRYKSAICDERTRWALLKCAAFLHDIAKAEIQAVTEDGQTRLIGHGRVGAEMATCLGHRWRCSNDEIDMLRTVIEAYVHPMRLATHPPLTRRAVHRFFRDTGEYGIDAAFIALADYMATSWPDLQAQGWKRQVETVTQLWAAYYEHRDTVINPPPLLSGKDLIDAFNLSPGPKIGKLLAQLREAQAAGEIHTREEAIAYARQYSSRQQD